LVGCGVAFLLAGVHFLADIDQVDLLGGGGELIGLPFRENYFLYLYFL
jgi:hypothetical protein